MEEAQFQQALRQQTPRVWVTPTLLAANIIVFAALAAKGVNPVKPSAESMIPWGADYGPLTLGGEWWRLLTAMFLHFGVIHLLMNMFVLWGIGGLVERLYGNVPFLILYLCAGLAGSVASEAWNPLRVSAGASGAVFGVYGALGAYLLRQRHVIPGEALRRLAQGAGIFILYNVIYGFSRQGIDNAAHMGGLAGGFIFGLVQAAPLGTPMSSRLVRSAAVIVLAAGLSFGILRTRATPPDFIPQINAAQKLYQQLDDLDSRSKDRYNSLIEPKDPAQEVDEKVVANVVENEILPEYGELAKQLEALPPEVPKMELPPGMVARYVRAEEAAWRLVAEGFRAHDKDKVKRGIDELDGAGRMLEKKP